MDEHYWPLMYINTEISAAACRYKIREEARQAILQIELIEVRLCIIYSKKIMKKQMAALRDLNLADDEVKQQYKNLLLGKDVEVSRTVNIYQSIFNKSVLKKSVKLKLSTSQRRGIGHCRLLPNRLGPRVGDKSRGHAHCIYGTQYFLYFVWEPNFAWPRILSPSLGLFRGPPGTGKTYCVACQFSLY